MAALNLRDAADAAAAGSVPLRATAVRLQPAVAATERLAYGTIAACWAMESGAATPLLDTDTALAYRAQLHRLAVAVRRAATPTDVDFEATVPDVLRDEVTALCEALRPSYEP